MPPDLAPQIQLCRAPDIRAAAPSARARLLADRLWPRGIAKRSDFTADCRAELTTTPAPLAKPLEWCRKGPVSLIYAAKDTEQTHALILRDVLLETLTQEAINA